VFELNSMTIRKIDKALTILLIMATLLIFIAGGFVYGKSRGQSYEHKKENDTSVSIEGDIFKSPDSCFCNVDTSTPCDSWILDEIGEFKITAYTAGFESTGKYPGDPAFGITASGATVQEDLTIAADWDVLPLNTWVYIEDVGYRFVQDKGGGIKGNCIDLYISNLDQAQEWGVQQKRVWLVHK